MSFGKQKQSADNLPVVAGIGFFVLRRVGISRLSINGDMIDLSYHILAVTKDHDSFPPGIF